MKTLGKIGLGFFIAFLVLLITGCVLLASTGELSGAIQQALHAGRWNLLSYTEIDDAKLDVEDNQELDLNGIKTIVLEVSASKLSIKQAEDMEKLSADFKSASHFGGRHDQLGTSRQGDTLYVQVKQERKGLWWFNWRNSYNKLDVTIPSSYKGDIKLIATAGKADVKALALEGAVEINFNAGQLNLESLRAESLSLNSTATDLNLGDLELQGDCTFSTTANALRVDSLKAKNVEISSTGAGVEIQGLEAPVTCNSTAAGIQMEFTRVVGDVTIDNTAATTQLTFPKGALIRVIADDIAAGSVTDHIDWTGEHGREMKDYQYVVQVSGAAASLVLEEK